MQKTVIVKGLVKSYGGLAAVDHLDLEVVQGEIFGLLGHNGAGKSTTIECILGVKAPDQGTVEVLGLNAVKDRKRLFEKVGVQFQHTGYQDKIKVWEICEVTHSMYRHPVDWMKLLEQFELAGMQNRLVSELSGGERQKLSVLLALIPNPELVFLDELTTGLDAKARRSMWRHLEGMKKKGLTIVLTSHYMDEVELLCDRVCILRHGRIVAMDTVERLIAESLYNNMEDAYLWYSGEEEAVHEVV